MRGRRRALQALAALAGPIASTLAARADEAAWPGASWDAAAPAASGWNADRLREADRAARGIGSDAVRAVQRGRVVHEHGDTTKPVNIYSGRKSVLGVLLGMQVDAGRLNPDSTLAALGIDDKQGLSAVEKTATVRHLLQSRSGIYHPAAYETLAAKAERPARCSHAPGTDWYCNNWDFNTLGTVYRQASGKTVFEGLLSDLATPLQMQHFRAAEHTTWELERSSQHPAYVMQLSARDFARFGLFWTRAAGDVFFASGNHGQMLWVDRARDIVVVHSTDHTRWLRASPDTGQLVPAAQAPLRGAARGMTARARRAAPRASTAVRSTEVQQ